MAQYKGAALVADPPTHHFPHLTKQLTTSEAQNIVADYLKRSKTDPSLHPDAWLSTSGVKHGPRGGATGGITMHYLGRIEAGLRGESLAVESKEDLIAQFGDEAAEQTALPAGDDSRLDASIAEAKKERNKKSRKRKRSEDIEAWAEKSASEAGAPEDSAGADDDSEWQTKEEYERSQTVLEGEVGGREGAPVVKQNGPPPVVVTHGVNGEIKVPKKGRTEGEKAARKAAKKAKRLEEKQKRAAALAANG